MPAVARRRPGPLFRKLAPLLADQQGQRSAVAAPAGLIAAKSLLRMTATSPPIAVKSADPFYRVRGPLRGPSALIAVGLAADDADARAVVSRPSDTIARYLDLGKTAGEEPSE